MEEQTVIVVLEEELMVIDAQMVKQQIDNIEKMCSILSLSLYWSLGCKRVLSSRRYILLF